MSDAERIPWPAIDADERAMLIGFLDGNRTVLTRKASGLDAQQLSQTLPPSDLTLGGLVKHMAAVEDGWFENYFAGRDMPEPWASVDWDADPDWELHSAADDSFEELMALFNAGCDRSRRVVSDTASLDELSVEAKYEGKRYSLRWILVHMIEEYARHAGHADLLRQSIDGATGD